MTSKARIFRILIFIDVQCQKLEILKEMALASTPGRPLFLPFLDSILQHEGPCICAWGQYSQEIQAPSAHPALPTNSCSLVTAQT